MMNDYDGDLQAHIVIILIKIFYMFDCKVQFSYHEYSLCPKEYSLCISRIKFSISIVQFKSQEYSLCPLSTVYVLRVQFMSLEYSLFPKNTVYVL